nr:type II toxin-antitoxin system HicB family antitoxin [uncultured Cardiobacterium sp.]
MTYVYPVAVFKDEDNTTYGGVVPDVPGCYPCGDSIQEIIEDSRKAIAAHIEFLLDTGRPFDFKNIRSVEELQLLPDYAGAVKWVLVEIDDTVLTVGKF